MWSIALIWVACAASVLSSSAPPCTTDGNDGTFFADDDCTKYWRCASGVAYEFTCPSALNFNPTSDVCDYVASAGCTGLGWDTVTEAPLIPPTPPPTEITTIEVPSSTATVSTTTLAPSSISTTTSTSTTTTPASTTSSTTTSTSTTTTPAPTTPSTTTSTSTTTTPAPTTPSTTTSTSTTPASTTTITPRTVPSTPPSVAPPIVPTTVDPYSPCWLYWWRPSCWNPQNGEPRPI